MVDSLAYDKKRVDSIVMEYLFETKSWQQDEFRVEHKEVNKDNFYLIVWGVFLQDELKPVPGAGQSVELHIDLKQYRILKELGFQ